MPSRRQDVKRPFPFFRRQPDSTARAQAGLAPPGASDMIPPTADQGPEGLGSGVPGTGLGAPAQSRAWAASLAILPPASTILTGIVTARYLGASGLGHAAFIAFVRQTVVLLLTLGLPAALVRFVGESLGSGRAGRIYSLTRYAWRFAVPAAVAGFAGMAAVGFLGGQPRWAWVLAAVTCAAGVLNAIASALLTGSQRWRDAYIYGLLMAVVGPVVKIPLLAAGGGVTMLFAVDAVTGTVAVVGTILLARRVAREILPAEEPAGDLTRRMGKFAAIGSGGVVINLVVYRRTELFFLERYSSYSQIALYSVPFSAIETLILLPRMLGIIVGPAVATLFGAGEFDRISASYGRALRTLIPVVIFVTAAAVAIGPTLLTSVYGPEFRGARVVFVILIATAPFVPLMALASSFLFGLGKQWVPTAIGVVAGVVNIGLDFALIPHFDAIGAAIANSSAQIIGAVPLAIYAARCVGGASIRIPALLRAVLAASLAGGAAALVLTVLAPAVGLPVAIVTFVIVSFPAAVLLRIMSADDAAWLRDSTPRWISGPVGFAVQPLHSRRARIS